MPAIWDCEWKCILSRISRHLDVCAEHAKTKVVVECVGCVSERCSALWLTVSCCLWFVFGSVHRGVASLRFLSEEWRAYAYGAIDTPHSLSKLESRTKHPRFSLKHFVPQFLTAKARDGEDLRSWFLHLKNLHNVAEMLESKINCGFHPPAFKFQMKLEARLRFVCVYLFHHLIMTVNIPVWNSCARRMQQCIPFIASSRIYHTRRSDVAAVFWMRYLTAVYADSTYCTRFTA